MLKHKELIISHRGVKSLIEFIIRLAILLSDFDSEVRNYRY